MKGLHNEMNGVDCDGGLAVNVVMWMIGFRRTSKIDTGAVYELVRSGRDKRDASKCRVAATRPLGDGVLSLRKWTNVSISFGYTR